VASCSGGVKQENLALKAELESLKQENEMLAAGTFNMAHSIENYHETLQQIDAQLAAIDEKKELVKSKSTEFKNDAQVEEEIKLHMEHIHEMTENSKHKIAHMSRNMDMLRRDNIDSHQKIHELENEVHDLAHVVVIRDQEINNLHNMVIGEGITIMALADAYNEQLSYSDVLLDIINTGFFVAGTKKELKEMGIIDLEGGFIGIGRVKSLNANAPVQFLMPIDIRDTDLIELTGKKAELITPHPLESYEFTVEKDKEQVFLGIANKLKFWQETNYLVVEIVN
jgi:hypothetical protein